MMPIQPVSALLDECQTGFHEQCPGSRLVKGKPGKALLNKCCTCSCHKPAEGWNVHP